MRSERGCVAAALLALASVGAARVAWADAFEAEAAGFHVRLESGALTQGVEFDTITGTVSIWPVASPFLRWTLRNARVVLPKGLAASGAGSKAAGIAVGPGALGGVVAVGEGAKAGAVAVGPGATGPVAVGEGAKGSVVSVGPGSTGGAVSVGEGSRGGGVAVGTGATGGVVGAGDGATGGAVAVGHNARSVGIAAGQGATGTAVTIRSSFEGTGDLDVYVGPRRVVVGGVIVRSSAAAELHALALSAGKFVLGACAHSVENGSFLSPAHLTLVGSLRCGSWAVAASTLTLEGGGISGGGTLTAWGKSFAMAYGASGDGLRAQGALEGADTPWNRIPGFEAEFRIERPRLELVLVGAVLTPSFGASRIAARTIAKRPDSSPWSSSSLSPGVVVIPAPPAGPISVPYPNLAPPADVEKGARDACESGARKTLAGQALQHALDVCRSGHPAPPAVPNLPRTGSLSVGEVFP